MGIVDNAALARLCRAQARLASTAETRATLLELALIYDAADMAPLPSIRPEPPIGFAEES
jgi:hypothetical protein